MGVEGLVGWAGEDLAADGELLHDGVGVGEEPPVRVLPLGDHDQEAGVVRIEVESDVGLVEELV